MRDVLIVGLIIIIIVAVAGAVVISVAIVAGAIFACKDNLEQKKIDRLEPRMMEQAEKGLMEREATKNDRERKDGTGDSSVLHEKDQRSI